MRFLKFSTPYICIYVFITVASPPILVLTDMIIMKSSPTSLATIFNYQLTYYNEFNLGQKQKKINGLTQLPNVVLNTNLHIALHHYVNKLCRNTGWYESWTLVWYFGYGPDRDKGGSNPYGAISLFSTVYFLIVSFAILLSLFFF